MRASVSRRTQPIGQTHYCFSSVGRRHVSGGLHPARLTDWGTGRGEGGGGGVQRRRNRDGGFPRSIRGCGDKTGDAKFGLRFILGVFISFRACFVGMLRSNSS